MTTENTVAVGNGPDQPAVDLNIRPLTQGAWEWMQSRDSIGSGIRPSNYFTMVEATKVALALGRQITDEEVKLLVVPDDGGRVKCAICGNDFQPVRWLVVTRELISSLRGGQTLDEAMGSAVWRGSFFCPPGRDPFGACGSPFKFNPQTREYYHPSGRESHLVECFRQNKFGPENKPHWGVPRFKAEFIAQRREAVQAERAAVKETAAGLFSRNGGRRDWNPGNGNGNGNGGSHGYHGQHGRTARRAEKRDHESLKSLMPRD